MPAATIDVNQSFITGATESSNDILLAQAYVLAAGSHTADLVYARQSFLLVPAERPTTISARQAFLLVAARGRVADPNIRVWTYTLDGHDYYVIRLGNDETLVCDLSTKQWSTFGSGDGNLWRAYTGTNWIGADSVAATYGSNIIVGDDGNGSLYFLNPNADLDDDALLGSETPRTFHRAVMGQITTRGYSAARCYGATLYGSVGSQETAGEELNAVTLSYSDDGGDTFTNAGTVSTEGADWNTRLTWRSLGSFRYPGRLFKVEDYGALKRIDSLEMEDGQ